MHRPHLPTRGARIRIDARLVASASQDSLYENTLMTMSCSPVSNVLTHYPTVCGWPLFPIFACTGEFPAIVNSLPSLVSRDQGASGPEKSDKRCISIKGEMPSLTNLRFT